jgi:hypothetical protein
MSCINVVAGISLQNTVNLYRIGHFYFAKTGHYYIALTNHLCIFTDYVTQRIGKHVGVIEYLDLVGIEITRHTLGITNSRQGAGNNNSVIAGKDAL